MTWHVLPCTPLDFSDQRSLSRRPAKHPTEKNAMRNSKTKLPPGHPRKYTSNGTKQVSQEKRIQHNKELIAAGQRKAEQEAEAAIAAARAEAEAEREAAAAERAKAAAVESHWKDFDNKNLADAVRQRDAAQWRAVISEKAFDEVYSTARESMDKAGRILSVTTIEGAKRIRDAGEAAGSIIASNLLDPNASLKDLSNATDLQRLYGESEYLAKLAVKTAPFSKGMKKIRTVHQNYRAQQS